MKKKILFILFISGCFLTGSNAQSIAVKSNLLYDATSTLNMGVELGLSRQWTLDVPLNYNPWKPGNGRRLRHWGIQPELPEKKKSDRKPILPEEFKLLKDHLSRYFNTKVQLTCNEKGKGKITIPFATEEELEQLIGLLDKLK